MHTWHHMSGDEPWLVGNPLWLTAQWTGWNSPCGALLSRGPASCQQKESTAVVQHMKDFPLHVLLFSFSICGSMCKEGICTSLREHSSGNLELIESEFLMLLFWGSGLWYEVLLTGRQPGKMETSASPTKHQEKERIVQNLLLSTLFSLSQPFLKGYLYSLGLALDGSRGDHHHAVLQRVVTAPPGLPEDALLPLVPVLRRRTLEVSAI